MKTQARTATADGAKTVIGECERCHEVATVWLNGRQLLCWDHYCAEMAAQRVDGQQSP